MWIYIIQLRLCFWNYDFKSPKVTLYVAMWLYLGIATFYGLIKGPISDFMMAIYILGIAGATSCNSSPKY